ncbi:MAG: ABC transporter ATP-binding protein [Halodesulfurarchaeum sp.]
MTMLAGTDVTKEFDGLVAVDHVDFEIEEGRIYSLIGPNGAGKTTLFNLVTGYHEVTEGQITFEGTDITDLDPMEVNRLGIARTFQLVQPFEGMTVYDNVKVGALFGSGTDDPDAATRRALELTDLWDRREETSQGLPIAGTKLLEIAKAVATQPDLILVDEPAAGLNVTETNQVLDILRELVTTDVTVWLVEHDMDAVMDVSDHVFVLDAGELIAQGPPEEVANDERVIEAYLGSDFEMDESAEGTGGEA